jgi:hypothetical protein
VALHRALRGDAARALADLNAPVPGGAACVVTGPLPSPVAGALARSAWQHVAVHSLASRVGYHEALGAFALVVAAAEVAAGRVEQALVVTADVDTVYVTHLEACRGAA